MAKKKKYAVCPPTDAEKAAFLKALRTGHALSSASAKANASRSTTYKWRANDPSLDKAVAIAIDKGKAFLVDRIVVASRKSWQAAAWLLERMHWEEFGKQDKFTEKDFKAFSSRLVSTLIARLPDNTHAIVREVVQAQFFRD